MKKHLKTAVVAAIAMAAVWATPGQAAGRSIVGTWAPNLAACTPVAGMISIGPKSLTGDEMSCLFADVVRSGQAVTWHGHCSGGGANRAATVTATLAGKSLRVLINGQDSGIFRRCLAGPTPESASKTVEPWPGDRWQADVDEERDGHRLHATLLGSTTETGKGDRVQVTCTDKDFATGAITVRRHPAWALSRQGDWEGDAGPLGSFGSADGADLRWFGPSPCPSGPITWKRLQGGSLPRPGTTGRLRSR